MLRTGALKIAFVNQPWSVVTPPVQSPDSIALWTDQIVRRIAPSCEVIQYSRRIKGQPAVETIAGVQYRRFPTRFDQISKGLQLILDQQQILAAQKPFFASYFYYLTYIWRIAIDLSRQNCDIVHIHNFSQFVPIIRAFNPHIKIVLHMHCEWLTQLDARMIERRLQQVDRIIGCSAYITQTIQKHFPALRDRCVTVFNGVDTDLFHRKPAEPAQPENAPKELIFVGRLSPEKGVHVLLAAFQRVLQHDPQVKLKIIGPKGSVPEEFIVRLSTEPAVQALKRFYTGPEYRDQLKQQLTPDACDRTAFLGTISHSHLLEHYETADILINPSLSEAFGMSLAEGMAMEIPVIGTLAGGMPDVVEDGKTGLLVPANQADKLAEAILYLLQDPDLRQTMGKAGRQRVLRYFSWDQVATSLLRHYQLLCDKESMVRTHEAANI